MINIHLPLENNIVQGESMKTFVFLFKEKYTKLPPPPPPCC